VKPFVKRQKNDMADAEAICEAAQRPTMRFVPVKSEAAQASALVFRTRDLLVRQRTQLINALRGHMTEFGMVVAQGPVRVARLVALVEDPDSDLLEPARIALGVLIAELHALDERVLKLDTELVRRAKEDPVARRLMTIPGIGAITATALVALAPPAATFRRGRDFAAWLGHAGATIEWRQGAVGSDIQNGRTNSAAPAYHRGERGRRLGFSQRRNARNVVGQHDVTQTADAGEGRARQQNGPNGLGAARPWRGLSSSGRGGVSRQGRGVPGSRLRSKENMAQRS
jgi:transposase